MKVLLKKSTEDMNWGGDDYDIISLNPIPTIETIGDTKTNVSSSKSGL